MTRCFGLREKRAPKPVSGVRVDDRQWLAFGAHAQVADIIDAEALSGTRAANALDHCTLSSGTIRQRRPRLDTEHLLAVGILEAILLTLAYEGGALPVHDRDREWQLLGDAIIR